MGGVSAPFAVLFGGAVMINLVWRTDVHMSDKAPSSRLDDWTSTVLGKLGQVRDLAVEVNAAAILDGGGLLSY